MLTVLTPTYNRANELNKLYLSLCKQNDKDFEWMIIDDGSVDNTEAVCDSFIKDNHIRIRYLKKENGGKHTALNYGIKRVDTIMTIIVDSDDCLTIDAVQEIKRAYKKYKNKDYICGFSFLRKNDEGIINGKRFDKDELVGSLIDVRINGNDASSDKAEVYYSSILKQYPFPEYPGEKFLGEDVVWMRIARQYSMVFINKAIYIGTYLDGGLTKNRRIHNIKSPNGCVDRAKEYMKNDICFLLREKGTLQYLIYGWFANKKTKELIKSTYQKRLVILNLVPAKLLYIKWKIEFEENKND